MRRIASIAQLPLDSVLADDIDTFIVSCGYELRSPFAASALGAKPIPERVCLGFVEHAKDTHRRANDALFIDLGFEIELFSGDDYQRVGRRVARSVPEKPLAHVVMDVSSMTRAWCWSAIRNVLDIHNQALKFTFLYSVAEYDPPPHLHAPPRVLGPLPGISTALEMPDKPIALVMGLGYEPDKALGIMEYVEPLETLVFYTDPAPDGRYVQALRKVNREVFRRVPIENTFGYPYNNILIAFSAVESLLRGLVQTSRVIATPMGPKPFALALFLASLEHRSVDVWRVSGTPDGLLSYRRPTGEVLALQAVFNAR